MAMEDISDITQWEYVDIDYPAICGQCEKVCEGNSMEIDGIGTYCAYDDDGSVYGCYYDVMEEINEEV